MFAGFAAMALGLFLMGQGIGTLETGEGKDLSHLDSVIATGIVWPEGDRTYPASR